MRGGINILLLKGSILFPPQMGTKFGNSYPLVKLIKNPPTQADPTTRNKTIKLSINDPY